MNLAIGSWRSAFLAVERRITQAAVMLGCLGLVLAALAGLYQVIARFILFQPASWSEPFVQAILIWMTYLALAGAMRTGTLISVDLLLARSQGWAKAALRAFITLAVMALLLVILWFGCILVWRVQYQTIAGLNISASWAYAALPVGAVLSILALVAHAIDPPQADEVVIESGG
jgi:TRAP-type C4-dicarboxylate transport system permease small subunit